MNNRGTITDPCGIPRSKDFIYVIGLSNLHKLFPNPISEMRFEQFYDAVTEFVNAQW